MASVKDDILTAVYKDYVPQIGMQAAYFDRNPYFILADEYQKKNTLLGDQMAVLQAQKTENRVGAKVFANFPALQLPKECRRSHPWFTDDQDGC